MAWRKPRADALGVGTLHTHPVSLLDIFAQTSLGTSRHAASFTRWCVSFSLGILTPYMPCSRSGAESRRGRADKLLFHRITPALHVRRKTGRPPISTSATVRTPHFLWRPQYVLSVSCCVRFDIYSAITSGSTCQLRRPEAPRPATRDADHNCTRRHMRVW